MSPIDQRIAIAEACGWEVVDLALCNVIRDEDGDPALEPVGPLPDYLNDLNAMHEAEKTLNTEQEKRIYVDHLVCRMKPREFTVMAPAPQRAEAFLRTLNLWNPAA